MYFKIQVHLLIIPFKCYLRFSFSPFGYACLSAFRESSHQLPNMNLSSNSSSKSDNDLVGLTEATVNEAFSENNNSTLSKEISEGKEDKFLAKSSDERINLEQIQKGPSYTHSHHLDSVDSSLKGTSSKCVESVETSEALDTHAISDLQFSPDTQVVFSLDEQQKMNRLLSTEQKRLFTSKTDVEDLMARLNQELALSQYLMTKVFSVFHQRNF